MAAEFTVADTKFTITDLNFAPTPGSKEWLGLFNQVKVDLSKPDADNVFVFVKIPAVAENVYACGAIQAKTKALIALCQQQLATEIGALTGTTPQRDVDGVYNCADAQVMVQIAQIVRQTGVGAIDLWPLGPMEFAYLMSRSAILQSLIFQAIQKDAVMTPEQIATYQYATVPVPSKEAPGMTFIPAQVPANCVGKAPPAMPPVTPGSSCDPAKTHFDAASGTCLPGATAVSYQDSKTPGWVMPVAYTVGVLGVGALIWHFSRRDAKADLKRVTG